MSDLLHEDVPFSYIRNVWNIMENARRHTFIALTKRPQRMHEFLTSAMGRLTVRGYMTELPNVIGMVTAENQEQADKRIPRLLKCPFSTYGMSIEPMLGPVDFTSFPMGSVRCISSGVGGYHWCGECGRWANQGTIYRNRCPNCGRMNWKLYPERKIDWVIVGGETGPGARPMYPQWVRNIRDQCAAAGIPFLFKQWGSYKPDILDARHWIDAGWDPNAPKHGRILDGREWNEIPDATR
jgi:protein gp37